MSAVLRTAAVLAVSFLAACGGGGSGGDVSANHPPIAQAGFDRTVGKYRGSRDSPPRGSSCRSWSC
jgi:hypothetical protein